MTALLPVGPRSAEDITPTSPAIAVHDLTVALDGRQVVQGVSLEVPAGSVVAVVGPSGCGKSTLLRAVAGLVRPEAGSVVLDGEVVTDARRFVPPEQRRLGFVVQDHALFPHLTVGANVAFGLTGRRRRAKRARVVELLDLVRLPGVERRYPHELSGGEQQRVALARALAVSPRALLLDEPFASLDPALRSTVRDEVLALVRSLGLAAVLVTHERDEALACGDELAVMQDGRVVQQATPHEVFHRPASAFVARLAGDATFVPATHEQAGVVRTELGPLPVRPDGPLCPGGGVRSPCTCNILAVVRPDDIVVTPLSAAGASDDRTAAPDDDSTRPSTSTGEVVAVRFLGGHHRYDVRMPSGLIVVAEGDDGEPIEPGTTVKLTVAPRHAIPLVGAPSSP